MDLTRSPPAFSLRQLQYAVAVAETLNFRRAAERCHVSQPSLSAQLAQLEEVLGLRLFERDRRRVLVTPAGRELIERARKVLVEVAELIDAGQRAGDPLGGTLRIGVIPTVSPYLLPTAAPRLRVRLPRLTFFWREDKTADVVRALQGGDLDGAILALEADIGDLATEVIAKDPFVLAASPHHPLAKKSTPVTAAELRGVDVLLLADGHCFRQQALDVCQTVRAQEAEFQATSLPTLVQMVSGGSQVTLLPAIAVATEAKRAGLRTRPLAATGASRTLALVWRKGSARAPALREVASALREAFPNP